MSLLDTGITLCGSNDGTTFNTLSAIEICKNCGKRTLLCPHHVPKEKVIELPEGCTHLKISKVDSDMRMTMSTERNTRMSSIRDGVMFTLLESITSLEDIWQEIGIKEDQKGERSNTVMRHIQDLLKEMIAEEEDLMSKMKLRTQEYQAELEQLCKDLSAPLKEIPSNLSLLQLENRLRNDVDTLNKEKHDRLKTLKRLRTEETYLCDRLVMPQHDLNFVGCPSLDQLRELEQNVKFLKAEKNKRLELFSKLQVAITRLWEELEAEPTTDIEQQLCQSDAEEAFVLSTQKLDELTRLQQKLEEEHNALVQQIDSLKEKVISLWERLETPKAERNTFLKQCSANTPKIAKKFMKEVERLEELKRQHMQKFIDSIRKELQALWDKCYLGEEQRQLFRAFYSDVYTEETLADHEHQVASMKSYYNDNKELFKLVEKREALWKKKIEFENRSSDSNRLNNRGGALLKEEKMRKAVEKELPKIECEIRKNIIKWEKENETYFMVNGNRFVDFMEMQRNEYEAEQQLKKEQKMKAKKQEISQESAYGAKPAKRKLVGTPSRSSKVSRIDQTGTPSRFTHSTILPSPRLKKPPVDKKSKSATKPKANKNKVISTNRRKSVKRRSIRLANAAKRQVLAEKDQNIFGSQEELRLITGSSKVNSNVDITLMSYNEFSNAVAESPHSRSSFLCPKTTERTPTMLNFTNISSKSVNKSSSKGNSTIFDRSSRVFRI